MNDITNKTLKVAFRVIDDRWLSTVTNNSITFQRRGKRITAPVLNVAKENKCEDFRRINIISVYEKLLQLIELKNNLAMIVTKIILLPALSQTLKAVQ